MKKILFIIGCLLLFVVVVCPAIAGIDCSLAENEDAPCDDIYEEDCYVAVCHSGGCEQQHEDFYEDSGTDCGGYPTDPCDAQDTCDGSGNCQPVYAGQGAWCQDEPGTECGIPGCDGNGYCNQGYSDEPVGTECGDAPTDDCHLHDACDGSGSCVEVHKTAGEWCQDGPGTWCSTAACDGAGECDQGYYDDPPGTDCGDAPTDDCHLHDACDESGECVEIHKTAGENCGNLPPFDECDEQDTCDGYGFCLDNLKPPGWECTDTIDDCYIARCDSGTCEQHLSGSYEPSGYPCGSNFENDCDEADTCDGSGYCDNNLKTTGTPCPDTIDDCYIARCDTGTCEQQLSGSYQPSGYPCGDLTLGVCDDADSCNAAGTCLDNFKPSDTVCRESAGGCDIAEKCTGSSATCPDDVLTSCLTDSSLCGFDKNPDAAGQQFRLIFTPNNTPSSWKLKASNPGQFYYNVMYYGAGNEIVTITLPEPFVTQGAMPIHVYSDVTLVTNDENCFVPGTEIMNSGEQVILTDYTTDTYTVPVAIPPLPSGSAYINIHLDYGLKGTTGYTKDAGNNAVDYLSLSTILIPDLHDYIFSDNQGGSTTIENNNVFKRDPGFAGLVTDANQISVEGVKVEIYKPDGKLLQTVYTDQDGWYMYQYKHTGKAMTYTIKLPAYAEQVKTVSLKANQLVTVDFQI